MDTAKIHPHNERLEVIPIENNSHGNVYSLKKIVLCILPIIVGIGAIATYYLSSNYSKSSDI